MNRSMARLAVFAALGIATVRYLPGRLPEPADLLDAFRGASPGWLVLAGAAQVVSMEMFSRQQLTLLRSYGVSLSPARSSAITYARSTISMVLPAGSVVSAGFAFRQWRARGATAPVAAAVMLLSGVLSFAGLITLYLVGSAIALALRPTALPAEQLRILAVALLLRVVAARAVHAWSARSRRHRPRVCRAVDRLRRATTDIVAAMSAVPRRHLLVALGFAAANWLADLTCLVGTARALHVRVDLAAVAGVYLLAQAVRQVPITPGGVGVIETTLAAGLVTTGVAEVAAAAAVLGYRLLSCWLLVPVGAVSWATLRTAGRPGRAQPCRVGR